MTPLSPLSSIISYYLITAYPQHHMLFHKLLVSPQAYHLHRKLLAYRKLHMQPAYLLLHMLQACLKLHKLFLQPRYCSIQISLIMPCSFPPVFCIVRKRYCFLWFDSNNIFPHKKVRTFLLHSYLFVTYRLLLKRMLI